VPLHISDLLMIHYSRLSKKQKRDKQLQHNINSFHHCRDWIVKFPKL